MSELELLKEIILKNDILDKILSRAEELGLKDYYVGAGCIAQTVWNYLSNNDLMYGIDDIDFLYFDKSDLTKEGEEDILDKIKDKFSDLEIGIDVKNEARVHLWYKEKFGYNIEPYKSLEGAIDSFPTKATSIGVRLENGEFKVYAPYGLDDLFNKIVRANKVQINKDIYYNKVNKWLKIWTDLVIVPWDAI